MSFDLFFLSKIKLFIMDIGCTHTLLDKSIAKSHYHWEWATHVNLFACKCTAGFDNFLRRQTPVLAGEADMRLEVFIQCCSFINLIEIERFGRYIDRIEKVNLLGAGAVKIAHPAQKR